MSTLKHPTMVKPVTKALDFIVIGAQKAGTTSLDEYLRTHPELYLPADKESALFSHDHDWYLKYDPERAAQLGRWEAFMEDVYGSAPRDRRWGKVSTSYMAGSLWPRGAEPASLPPSQPTEWIIPKRIREKIPAVRLVAILRDPVTRAFSAHRMSVLHRRETRPFRDAIADLLEPDALVTARRRPSYTNSYVVLGEYGRILSGYLSVFPREQLLIIFTDELREAPVPTLRSVFKHIEVNEGHIPPNTGIEYRRGAFDPKIRGLNSVRFRRFKTALSRNHAFRRLWLSLTPSQRRAAIRLNQTVTNKVILWNRRPEERSETAIDSDIRARLERHYAADTEHLIQLLNRTPPWTPDPL